MSLSFDHVEFRPFRWLECVGQASNAFPHHHHNSCHSWGSASCADICTTTLVTSVPFPCCPTEANTHTYAHTELHQLNASRANQKGIRDGCCLQTPMCGWVWMGPKGGEVSDTTGYQQGWHIAWPDRVCCDAWRVGSGDKPKVFDQHDPAFPAGLLHHSDVGGLDDLWAYGSLSCVHFAIVSLSISQIYAVWLLLISYTKHRTQT